MDFCPSEFGHKSQRRTGVAKGVAFRRIGKLDMIRGLVQQNCVH